MYVVHRTNKSSSLTLAPTAFAEMKKKQKNLIICYFLGNTSPLISWALIDETNFLEYLSTSLLQF